MSGKSEDKRHMFYKMEILSSPTTKMEAPKLKKLFEDDDDEDGDEGVTNFKMESSSSSRTPQQTNQLIDMRSKFAHDSRFQVDESFLDEEEEDVVADDLGKEKAANMDILESVLKKPLMPSTEKPVKEILIPRYDPLAADACKYEIDRKQKDNKRKHDNETSNVTTNGIDKNKKLKKDKNEKKTVVKSESKSQAPAPIPVSKERFYAVSSSLAQELKEKKSSLDTSGFKFGSLFDRDEDDIYEKPVVTDNLWHKPGTSSSSGIKQEKTAVKVEDEKKDPEVVDKERDLFRERFFFSKHDARLDEDPFFDRKVIKRLKHQMRDKLVKGIDVTLAKKNKAAKNKRHGHVYQTFKRKTEDGDEFEEKVLKNKDQFKNKKFKSSNNNKITNKLSARQERLKREREENKKNKKNNNKTATAAAPVKVKESNKGKIFFANKKSKI
jgi:hypothetical protein